MNTFVQHLAKHKLAYLVGLIVLLFGLVGWAYSRGSFNFSNLTGSATPPRCPQYVGTSAEPYHVQKGRNCVWSCSRGTTPDNATGECKCKPELTETSRDQFGRRVCTAAPAPAALNLQFTKNNSDTVLTSGRLTLLDFKIKSRDFASTITGWTFNITTNGNVNLASYELVDVKNGTVLPASGGGQVDATHSGVGFSGSSVFAANQQGHYRLTAEVAAPSPALYTGVTTTLNPGAVLVSGPTPTPATTGLPISHVLGDMTPGPAMSFSVRLTADRPANPVTGAIGARVGDVITFTHTITESGVVNNGWERRWDSAKLNCINYPEPDDINARCTVLAPGSSEIYTTMHPVFWDGHTETVESNHIAVQATAVVLEPGTLTIREMSSPQASILVAGGTQQLVAQYELSAAREAFEVNKLTVINDMSGNFDSPTDTPAVRYVKIGYRDRNNGDQLAMGVPVAGSTTFTLTAPLYVPADSVSTLKIYADIMTADFGQTLSGQHFRLGLKDNNVDGADGTFRAVGAASAQTEYNPSITGAASVYEHIVRFTKPTVAKDGGDEPLTDGAKNLYKVRITADPARDIEVKRLVFRVASVFVTATDDLFAFRIREGVSGVDLLDTEATIMGKSVTGGATVDLYSGSTWDQVDGIDNGSGDGYVVVEFVTARTVSAGASKTFILKASVSGASQVGERIATYIPDDTSEVSGDAATVMTSNSNFVWSDRSSLLPLHSETTTDWANGYLVPDLQTAAKVMEY